MKPLYTLLCFLLSFYPMRAQETDADDAILFEISGNGLNTPSYLLGTWHNIEGAFAHKIQELDSKL